MIKEKIKDLARTTLKRFGYRVSKIPMENSTPSWIIKPDSSKELKLFVGTGTDLKEGYINCARRKIDRVALVCLPWNVSDHCQELAAVYSCDMIEYLTDSESRLALEDWYDALAIGGTVEIVVPNIEFHINQWLSTDWESDGGSQNKAAERSAFAGLYGTQRECNPKSPDYNNTYWDVHKSGYDTKRISHLLRQTGFALVETQVFDQCDLVAKGTKLTQKGERQVAHKLGGIREDHRSRYAFAATHSAELPPNSKVGDFACGVGYGAKILSDCAMIESIHAVDLDPGALEYARQHYSDQKISYEEGDITKLALDQDSFDLITSFETIEHLQDPRDFLVQVYAALKPGGLFICSSPNEEVIPLAKMNNPYHFRHYTPDELHELLSSFGFKIEMKLTQTNRNSDTMESGWHGIYNIAACRK